MSAWDEKNTAKPEDSSGLARRSLATLAGNWGYRVIVGPEKLPKLIAISPMGVPSFWRLTDGPGKIYEQEVSE